MRIDMLRKIGIGVCLCAMVLGGCAAEQQQTTRRYLWPRPPDQPRIEWLKSYYSQHDFPKSGFDSFIESVFGQAPAISFEKPIDIKSNGEGMVYVTDIAARGIIVYDLNNHKVELWEKGADIDNSLAILPFYIALDRNDNIYAVGQGVKMVYVLDKKGKVINKIDFTEHVKSPGGIVVDKETNRVYLVDTKDAKVAVFEASGKFLFTFGKPGDGEGELNRPIPITINHKGEILVGDVMNARVQIFNKEGKFLRKIGSRGDSSSEIQIMKGVAVDSDDNIYVTDGKSNQLKIFSTKGEYLMTIGTAYSVTKTFKEAPGGFLLPQGIDIDKNNNIYIADQANMRFQIFRYLGDSEAKK